MNSPYAHNGQEVAARAWREIERALVEYFRAEGSQTFAENGESYLIVSRSRRRSEQEDISLSDLARKLTDPTS